MTDVFENIAPIITSGSFSLTAGADTVVVGAADDTVYATAATLNAGDSLRAVRGRMFCNWSAVGRSASTRLGPSPASRRSRSITLQIQPRSSRLGSQPIELEATGYLSVQAFSPSNWNGSNIIKGDASQAWATTGLNFYSNWNYPQTPATYDLTSNTLSDIGSVTGNGNDLTLLINSADTTNIQSFSAWGQNDRLVTAGSTLDLSHTTVSGFTVSSTNGLGTAFTVGDLGTAFQIAGGSGHDTLIAQGFTLTADQRIAIFETSSVETIVDQGGTYAGPLPSPGIVGLTSSNDTVVAPASGSTVYATAATLNAGDSLTGGAGKDVLQLVGSGTFRVDQVGTFTGFEKIALNNATNSTAQLTLGSQPIELEATGYLSVQAFSPSNWNGSNIIKGDASQAWATTGLNFYSNWNYPQTPATYDLTSNTLSDIGSVTGNGNDLTLLINSADTTNIQSFSAWGQNDRLVTAGSTLDLSHTTVSGFTVSSTNGLGTAFTVGDLGTHSDCRRFRARYVIAQGFTLTADQLNTIFATASVEKIIDSSGTYTAPPQNSGVFALTTGSDIVTGTAADDTVNGTAGTLSDFGSNTVNGFVAGLDSIQFDHAVFADMDAVQSHMQQLGSDVVIAEDAHIEGGASADVLKGNAGADTFVFKPNFGRDIVADFASTAGAGANHDVLEFQGVFANAQAALDAAVDVGNDVLITLDANNSVTLTGIHKADLALSDFHIV